MVRAHSAYSNATDAAVTFSFTGVAAVYLAQQTADRGICLLTLDNTIPYTVDLYNDSGYSSGLQVIWSSGTLPYGQHNVTITQIGPDARFGCVHLAARALRADKFADSIRAAQILSVSGHFHLDRVGPDRRLCVSCLDPPAGLLI